MPPTHASAHVPAEHTSPTSHAFPQPPQFEGSLCVRTHLPSQTVAPRRESMRVSWFSTAGTFDADRTGRTEAETETRTANGWLAPPAPGPATIWIVLRDSRGGVDFATYPVTIVP